LVFYEGDAGLVSDWCFMRETSDWCFMRATSGWCQIGVILVFLRDWCHFGVS